MPSAKQGGIESRFESILYDSTRNLQPLDKVAISLVLGATASIELT